MRLLNESPTAQDKMLCSEDMQAAEESRKATLVFCAGRAWLFICLGKEQALLPVAKRSNAEKYVSYGYSGDLGDNKHFSLRKSA